MSELHAQSLRQLSEALQRKAVSATELAHHFLKRAQADTTGSFLSLDPDATLAQAKVADERLANGSATRLTGIPIAHKDIFVTRDWPTTAGSRMLEGHRSPFDATVVARLGHGQGGAGMVTLGKLSCDEFAMGSSNENCAFGPVKNPWDTTRIPGGSSGASAAAVAAGLSPAATGTDTGGSIRQPAAFCGITGIKPTYGRASRYGMIAYASSLDQAGAMARSAEDCAWLLSALCGPDLDRDATSLEVPSEDFAASLGQSLKGLRVGIPMEWWGNGVQCDWFPNMPPRRSEGTQVDIQRRFEDALEQLTRLGATLVPISLPQTEMAIPAYYIIAPAEASSNLSRFDGVKFGHRCENPADLMDMYVRSRTEGFGEEVKRRILVGTYVLSHGYYDAYYLQAQRVRRLIADDFQKAFAQCDVIAGPVAPTVAWGLGEKANDPVANYLADIFTLPASLAGLPAMSVPVGFGEAGMPVGMQLIANHLQEGRLLNVAHQFQCHTEWHLKTPQGI